MKLIIIRALIGWLWRNHKWLLVEQVVGEGRHIHSNPRPKRSNPAVSGVDE